MVEFTQEEAEILKTALNGMMIQGASISQQAKFYAEKVMPLLRKLDQLKESHKEAAPKEEGDGTKPEQRRKRTG